MSLKTLLFRQEWATRLEWLRLPLEIQLWELQSQLWLVRQQPLLQAQLLAVLLWQQEQQQLEQ
jgi:hypothetical protein